MVDFLVQEGSLPNDASGSNVSSGSGEGGRIGSGLSGVLARKLVRAFTRVDRLPKLGAWDRPARLVVSDA